MKRLLQAISDWWNTGIMDEAGYFQRRVAGSSQPRGRRVSFIMSEPYIESVRQGALARGLSDAKYLEICLVVGCEVVQATEAEGGAAWLRYSKESPLVRLAPFESDPDGEG